MNEQKIYQELVKSALPEGCIVNLYWIGGSEYHSSIFNQGTWVAYVDFNISGIVTVSYNQSNRLSGWCYNRIQISDPEFHKKLSKILLTIVSAK